MRIKINNHSKSNAPSTVNLNYMSNAIFLAFMLIWPSGEQFSLRLVKS